MNRMEGRGSTGVPRVRNYRDVGASVGRLAGAPLLPAGLLLRGGAIRDLGSLTEIGSPSTILSLQARPDPPFTAVAAIHCPAPAQGADVYNAQAWAIRAWLKTVLRHLAGGIRCPVFIHCLSGVDRTGVVIASVLCVAGLPEELIIKEYCLSDGAPGGDTLRAFLSDLGDVRKYFRGLDLAAVRETFGRQAAERGGCLPAVCAPRPYQAESPLRGEVRSSGGTVVTELPPATCRAKAHGEAS